MLDVGQPEEGAVFRIVTGLGGDGDVLVGVRVERGVLGGGLGGRRFVVGGLDAGGCQEQGNDEIGEAREHGHIDYRLG